MVAPLRNVSVPRCTLTSGRLKALEELLEELELLELLELSLLELELWDELLEL